MKTRISNLILCSAPLLATLFFAGCASDPGRTNGRLIDDRGITSKVKTELNNSPVYKFPNVGVVTYAGVVQLSGFVYKDEQKTEAADLARRVPGVLEVINNVSLVPPAMGGTGPRETTRTGTVRDGRDPRDAYEARDPNTLPPPSRTP